MIGDLGKIGINARIVSYDWGTYLKRQREQSQDMDLFQLGWTGDNGDPDNFLAVLFDGMESAAVRTQWQNEAFHKLMDEGRTTTDQNKRAEIYKKAQQIMYRRVPGPADRPLGRGVSGLQEGPELQAPPHKLRPHEERVDCSRITVK